MKNLREQNLYQLLKKRFVLYKLVKVDYLWVKPFLDIGCGSGSVTIEAAIQVEESGKVIGVDIDPNAIELTEKKPKKIWNFKLYIN